MSGLFYIIPFYPIILAIGKTNSYANAHMIAAFMIVIAEYVVCKTFDSAVYVAITSELCNLFKIWLLLRVIANYAHMKITELLPPKPMTILIMISALASLPPFLLLDFLNMNKFIVLFVCLGFFFGRLLCALLDLQSYLSRYCRWVLKEQIKTKCSCENFTIKIILN